MAQQVTTESGTFIIPGAYNETKVEVANAGLSTTGVLMLVGEADGGAAFDEEEDLPFFGPDALASVIAKYRSGQIVDAFKIASQASNDNNIQGSPSRIYIAKTNVSAKASGTLARVGLSTNYGSLYDKGYGELGNLVSVSVSASAAEVAPTTGQFTYIPSPNAMLVNLRVNGGAAEVLTVGAKTSPASLVGTVESTAGQALNSLTVSSLNNIHATGGVLRGAITAGMVAGNSTLAVAASGNSIVITLGGTTVSAWPEQPVIGDTLLIPATGEYGAAGDSAIDGGTQANLGAYVVTAATGTTITATKLRNNSGTSVTAPENVGAVDIAAVTDFLVYSPVVINNATGTERSVLTGLVGQTITGTASGSTLTLTLATGQVWAANPQAGDLVLMPASAPAVWRASNTNGGWYQVTSATSGTAAGATKIVMTRLSNGNPASFVATAIAAVTDLRVLRPAIDGVGKCLEIFDGGGAESIAVSPYKFFDLSTSAVDWVSTSADPQLLLSASEYAASVNAANASSAISESLIGDGAIALKLGYHGGGTVTSATATVSGTTLTTSVSGGNGSNLSIDLTKFNTISDLVSYLNSQTGYSAAAGTALQGQQLLTYAASATSKATVLDKATWGIASANGNLAGRMKKSAYALHKKISENAILIQLGNPAAARDAGLPEVQSLFFLAGGTRGATTNARVQSAIDSLEKVRGNFVVTLFSRDAADDIAEGLTSSSSTYEIDDINAAVRSHVLAMSTVKRRRNRQGFASKKTSFTEAKEAANNLASARVAMPFQDYKFLDANGSIQQFPPWGGAVAAAAMQAAGFYKAIVKKFINCSGVLMADASFSDQLDSQVEDALLNGLLPAEKVETGGFRWISDQTTYAIDSNFVYNSIQAVYAMDIIALTLAQRLENAFVGQSIADVPAGVIVSFIKGIMKDLMTLKLIASSDDAAAGWKDLVVSISGPVARVSLSVKLAGALYFIPIKTSFSQVQQTAAA